MRIPALDGVRAMAVTMVVAMHMFKKQLWGFQKPEPLDTFMSFGWAGVDLFFVLSGFLVGGSILRLALAGEFRFGRFYMDRSLRILPIAYAFLLYWGWTSNSLGLNLWTLTNFLYVSNYVGANGPIHFWSLQIEELFYTVTPFLAVGIVDGLRRMKGNMENKVMWGLVAAIPAMWAVRWFTLVVNPPDVYETVLPLMNPLNYLDFFMSGMLISMFHARGVTVRVVGKVRSWFGRYGGTAPSAIVVASAMLVAVLTRDLNHGESIGTGVAFAKGLQLAWAWTSAMVFWFAGSSGREDEKQDAVVATFSGKRAKRVAVLSYSIYVWHWLLIDPLNIAQPFRGHLAGALVLQSLVNIVGMGGAAVLSYKYLETPFLKLREWIRNRAARKQAVSLAA